MTAPWIVAFLLLCAIVAVSAGVLLGLVQRSSSLLERAEEILVSAGSGLVLEGLSPGNQLPVFRARDASGSSVSDSGLRGTPTVVLFLDPGCGPCRVLAEELRRGYVVPAGVKLFVVLEESARPRMDVGPVAQVLYEEGKVVSKAFRTTVTPNAFALDQEGVVVARTIPNSVEQIGELAVLAAEGGDRQEATNSSRDAVYQG